MIIHAGYSKAGSRFFQKNVFPNMKGITFYEEEFCWKLFKNTFSNTTFEFDAEAEALKLDGAPNSLYSLQRLCGNIAKGTYNYEIVLRLKAMGFKKVIMIIRRQDAMVESLYRQYIQQGGVMKPHDFLNHDFQWSWAFLDYFQLLSHHVDVFGKENVLVFPLEETKDSMDTVLKKLKDFCGCEAIKFSTYSGDTKTTKVKGMKNKSLSFHSIKILRFLNHFSYNYYRPSGILPDKLTTRQIRYFLKKRTDPILHSLFSKNKQFFSDEFKAEVLKKYEESNRKVSEKFDLYLDRYGYF